jgi:ParB family chromosome partitioning protein
MNKPVAVQPAGSDAPPQAVASSAPNTGSPADASADVQGLFHVELATIRRNPAQPRQQFDEAALQGLADSIRSEGVMQPIVLRPLPEPGPEDAIRYEIVAGERRWRAARLAGLDTIPALVRDLQPQQVAEWALIENLQREDLNPLERADALRRLVDDFNLSHDELASRLGLQRSSVSNLLRLLSLAEPVQQLVRDGHLSMGQARAIAALPDPEAQHALALKAVKEALSVRQVEQLVRKAANSSAPPEPGDGPSRKPTSGNAHLADLEQQLADRLGTRVRLKPGRKKGSGSLTIEFYSLDQFDTLLEKLGVSMEA